MTLKPYAPYEDWWKRQRDRNRGKRSKGIDICQYCGCQYHPMPRWTKGNQTICVCSDEYQMWKSLGKDAPTGCSEKAKEDGFTRRMDLTPRR